VTWRSHFHNAISLPFDIDTRRSDILCSFSLFLSVNTDVDGRRTGFGITRIEGQAKTTLFNLKSHQEPLPWRWSTTQNFYLQMFIKMIKENLHHSIFGKIVVELTEIPPFFPERTLQLVDSRKWHLCGILRRSLPLDVRLTVGRGYRVLSWATGEEHPESLKPIFESLCHWEDLRTIRGLKSDCRSRENGY